MPIAKSLNLTGDATRGHLAMLLFSSLVAGSFALGGLAAPLLDPMALNAVRFWIAALAIGALIRVRGPLDPAHLASPWRFVVLGGLFAIYFGTMFKALQTAAPVSIATVFTLTPVMAAGFGWLLLAQVTTRRMALALGIAALGALWVIFDADLEALIAFRIGTGEIIFFVGCIAHAFYIPMVRVLKRETPLLVLTFGMLISGGALLSILAAPTILRTDWIALPSIVWITIFYTAIMASAATFYLVQYAALRLPSVKVMAYTYLVPVWVILWEIALGHGVPATGVLAGIALVVTGLLLLLKDEGN